MACEDIGTAFVGAVDEKTIREYVENQKWGEDGENFTIISVSAEHFRRLEPQPGTLSRKAAHRLSARRHSERKEKLWFIR